MKIKEANFGDRKRLSDIMVPSFRSTFASFVTRETLDAHTNEEKI